MHHDLAARGLAPPHPDHSPFVHSNDSGVADEAMRFIIRDVGRADLCLDLLLQWLGDENEFGFNQLTGVQLAGEAYRSTKDQAILQEIFRLMDHLEEEIRSSAAEALVVALTPGYETMPPNAHYQLRCRADHADYRRQAEALLQDR